MKKEIVKISKIAFKSASTEERIAHINIDSNIPEIIVTLCKPFVERCFLLGQVLLFDPDKPHQK